MAAALRENRAARLYVERSVQMRGLREKGLWRDVAEPCLQRLRTAFEQRRVVDGVRQHVLHVVARLGERNRFSKNRAFDWRREVAAPLVRTSRTGVVARCGEHRGVVELIVDH